MIFTSSSNGLNIFGKELNFDSLKNLGSGSLSAGFGETLTKTLIGSGDLTKIQKYFDAIETGYYDVESASESFLTGMSPNLAGCVTQFSSMGEALNGLGTSFVVASAKAMAFKAVAVGLNAIIALGVTAAIQAGVKALDNWIHSAEKIKEAGKTASDNISNISNSFKEQESTVKDIGQRYAELAQGVDQFTGKNKSLSTSDYEEFLSISNQLAETFPSLSRTYDENGNAIVNLNGGVTSITSSLQELLEVERQLANTEIASNLDDLYKGTLQQSKEYQSQITQLESKSGMNIANTLSNSLKKTDLFSGKGLQLDISGLSASELNTLKSQLRTIFSDAGLTMVDAGNGRFSANEWIRMSDADFEKSKAQITTGMKGLVNSYSEASSSASKEISNINDRNKQNWSGLLQGLTSWAQTDDNYAVLSDEMKTAVQTMMSNIDFAGLSASGVEGLDKLEDYIISNIIKPISSLSQANQIKLSDLFSIDTSNTSVNDYVDQVKSTLNDISKDSGIDVNELFDLTGLGKVSDEYKKAGKELKSLLKDADEHELELGNLSVDDTLAAIDAIKERGIDTWAELDALFNSGVLKPDIDISAETEAIKSLYEAIGNSNGATGLTADDISAIKSRYKDLDSYDYSKVFQKTSTGVHANTKALQELEDEYNNLQKAQQQAKLDDLIDRYDQLSQKMQEAQGDPIKYGQLSAERDGILDNINSCAELISQYEGLTSAYNKWIQAQSAGNARDKYTNISSGYSAAEKTLEAGWYGDESLNEYLDLVLSTSQRTGDAVADFAKLKQAIGDTGYSIWSFLRPDDNGNITTDGLYDMLDCVHALDDSLVKISGNEYSFDWSGEKLQQVADMLGMSTEAVQILEEAMQDAGFDIVFDSMFTDVERLNKGLDGTVEKLKEMAGNGGLQDINGNAIDIDLSGITGKASDLKEATAQMETLKSVLDQMKDSDGKLDISCEGASEALQLYSSLAQQKAVLENPTIMEFDCNADGVEAGVSEAMSLLQEFITATTAVDIMMQAGLDTSEAEANVDSILAKMSECETITADMNINTDSAESALSSIKENDAQIQASLSVDTSEAKAQIEEATGGGGQLEKQVKLNVDASELANIQSQIDSVQAEIPVSFNVVGQSIDSLIASATAATPSIPVTFTAESSEVDNYAATKKSGSGVVKWSNNSGVVDSYAATRKSAYGTVNWSNNTSAVKTHFTATGTVNWSNANGPGKAQGTAHARGSAYARGYWGVRQDENALVGEMGRKNCAPAQ